MVVFGAAENDPFQPSVQHSELLLWNLLLLYIIIGEKIDHFGPVNWLLSLY